MRTDWLKTIDARTAKSAVKIARCLRWLASRRQTIERPLLVRPGGMGDLVCLTMALENCGISPRSCDFLIERRSSPWADYLGLRYFSYDQKAADLLLSAAKYRTVVNTEQFFGLSQAASFYLLARGGKLVSFSSVGQAQVSSKQVSYDPRNTHEVKEFISLLTEGLGVTLPQSGIFSRTRRQKSQGNLVVALAGLQSESRALSVGLWEEIISGWSNGSPVILLAAKLDRSFALDLSARLPPGSEVRTDTFPKNVAAVATAERLLTIDGGMVHVASYFGIPTTAIFTSGQDHKWAPLGSGSTVLRRTDLSCQPCTLYGQVASCERRFACKDFSLQSLALKLHEST